MPRADGAIDSTPDGARPSADSAGRLRLGTRTAHAGTAVGATSGSTLGAAGETAHTVPIYQTANYVYPDAAAADRAAGGGAYLYSRIGNPTNDALERALAGLEGGEEAVSFASGMGAVAAALFACATGGEVVASDGIYGGSTELLRDLGPRHGIGVKFAPAWDLEAMRAAIGPRTRALLIETLTNPLLRVPDLAALGALAAERGLQLIVDSTFTSPVLCRPLEHGATVVVHSVSKYIGGHGDLVGGVAIAAAPVAAEVRRYRTLLGASMDPFCGWLALRGLRTLALRLERQCATAARVADVLAAQPGVRRVLYPGRPDHPDFERARRLLAAPGAMVSFQVADLAAARRFYDRVAVIARAASLGEVTSLLTHPATFSHRGLSPEERRRQGVDDGLLRLSVGIEDPQDLIDDVIQALGGTT